MRRKDREVTDPAEIVNILSRCEVLRIAINTDNAPLSAARQFRHGAGRHDLLHPRRHRRNQI